MQKIGRATGAFQESTSDWDQETVDFLLSHSGGEALAALADADLVEGKTLLLLTELRRQFAPPQAGALLTMARLRHRASAKFPQAARLYFTPTALEQATAWPLAKQRAEWLSQSDEDGPILDLGCGIGGDTLALAHSRPVIAYERDPVRLRLAQANVAALGLAGRVEFRQADWTDDLASGNLPAAAAAYADPTRRSRGRRLFSLYEIDPPLPQLLALQKQIPILAVKVMPGVSDQELPPNCLVQFVSHEGVCKEAVLWFGQPGSAKRLASVYVEGRWHWLYASGAPPALGDPEAGMVLYEPDPAVIRAGAFAELCTQLDAHLFDAQIAYLVGADWRPTPYAQAFAIEEVHGYSLKLLNRRLAALQIGQVELKKRGFPVEPEQLRGRLKLTPHGRAGVVIFTRRGDTRIMIICRRLTRRDPAATEEQL